MIRPTVPPSPTYQVSSRVVRSDTFGFQVQLSTRAANCPVPTAPPVALERLELTSPDGRLIRVLAKNPMPSGLGSYVGQFSIDMPATAPAGQYGVLITLTVSGKRCGAHQGSLHHRGSGNSKPDRADLRATTWNDGAVAQLVAAMAYKRSGEDAWRQGQAPLEGLTIVVDTAPAR